MKKMRVFTLSLMVVGSVLFYNLADKTSLLQIGIKICHDRLDQSVNAKVLDYKGVNFLSESLASNYLKTTRECFSEISENMNMVGMLFNKSIYRTHDKLLGIFEELSEVMTQSRKLGATKYRFEKRGSLSSYANFTKRYKDFEEVSYSFSDYLEKVKKVSDEQYFIFIALGFFLVMITYLNEFRKKEKYSRVNKKRKEDVLKESNLKKMEQLFKAYLVELDERLKEGKYAVDFFERYNSLVTFNFNQVQNEKDSLRAQVDYLKKNIVGYEEVMSEKGYLRKVIESNDLILSNLYQILSQLSKEQNSENCWVRKLLIDEGSVVFSKEKVLERVLSKSLAVVDCIYDEYKNLSTNNSLNSINLLIQDKKVQDNIVLDFSLELKEEVSRKDLMISLDEIDIECKVSEFRSDLDVMGGDIMHDFQIFDNQDGIWRLSMFRIILISNNEGVNISEDPTGDNEINSFLKLPRLPDFN
jgi:hypothetical protein